jgi:hypothetical protein
LFLVSTLKKMLAVLTLNLDNFKMTCRGVVRTVSKDDFSRAGWSHAENAFELAAATIM